MSETSQAPLRSDGRPWFTHNEIEELRGQYRVDTMVLNELRQLTGDLRTAQATLAGPQRDELQHLRGNPEDQEFRTAFEDVYGVGAADHYAQQREWQDHVGEIVPQVLGGIQEGIGQIGQFADSALEGGHLGFLLRNANWSLDNAVQAAAQDRGDTVVLPEDYDTALTAYEGVYRARTENWSDARRRSRLQQISRDLEYLEARNPNASDMFSRMTEEQREGYVRQLRTEAGILAEEPARSREERHQARREAARSMGATVMSTPTGIEVEAVPTPETLTGEVVGGIAQFAAGYAGPMAALGRLAMVAQSGVAGQFVASTLAGMLADGAAFDPEDPMFIDFVEEMLGADFSDTWVDFIRKGPEDSETTARLKQALEGAGLGGAISAVFFTAAGAWRWMRSGRRSAEEVAEEVTEAVQQITVETNGRRLSEEELEGVAEAVERFRSGDAPQAPQGPTAAPQRADASVEDDLLERLTPGSPRNDLEHVLRSLNEPNPRVMGVRQVQQVVRAVREKLDEWALGSVEDLRQFAVDTARAHRTIFRENRTDVELVRAAEPHVRAIMDMIRSGRDGIDRAVRYASEAPTMGAFMDKAFAYQSVARTLQRATDQAREQLRQVSGPGVPPEITQAANRLFDHVLEAYLKMETVNANYGSFWGAMGRSRQSAHVAREASDRRMAGHRPTTPDEAPQAVARQVDEDAARLRETLEAMEVARKEENYFWEWYQRLRTGGAKPGDAYDLIQDYINAGRREGVSPSARLKPDAPEPGDVSGTFLSRLVDRLVQYQYGSMLSGPDTHAINNSVSATKTVTALVSEGGWALARGDRADLSAWVGRITGMTMGMRDTWRDAGRALKEGRLLLSGPLDPSDPGKNRFFAWSALRLMAASDQLFSGNWYRGEVAARATREADIMGITGKAKREYIRRALKDAFAPDGRGIDLLAAHQSRAVTFQQPFNKQSKYAAERFFAGVMDRINHPNPLIRAVMNMHFPFTRIFFTLLDQGMRMSPVLHVPIQLIKRGASGHNLRFYDDLLGKNGKTAQARAAGEFTMGTAAVGAFYSMAIEGRITGGSPHPWQLDPLTNEIAPPYSIRIGDRWYPYGRYEPFAFQFKLLSNISTAYHRFEQGRINMDYETFSEEVSAALGAAGFVMGEVIASNPFMQTGQNLMDLISMITDPEPDMRVVERYLQGQLDKLIPNFARKINENFEDGYRFQGRTMWERMIRHFTWLDDNAFGLDPARNTVTGDLVRHRTPGTSLAPTEASDYGDPVAQMIIEAAEATGRSFELRRPTGWPGIDRRVDLRDVQADGSQRSLYDLFLSTVSSIEIDGRTYRQSLMELAENDEFRRHPWGNRRVTDNEKVQAILRLRDQYQQAATEVVRNQEAFQRLERQQQQREHLWSVFPDSPR